MAGGIWRVVLPDGKTRDFDAQGDARAIAASAWYSVGKYPPTAALAFVSASELHLERQAAEEARKAAEEVKLAEAAAAEQEAADQAAEQAAAAAEPESEPAPTTTRKRRTKSS